EVFLNDVKEKNNWILYESDTLSNERVLMESRNQYLENTQGKHAAEHKAAPTPHAERNKQGAHSERVRTVQ
ncbi:peptidoglycan-binding protein, partial [Stenotrophomonas maltophilia]